MPILRITLVTTLAALAVQQADTPRSLCLWTQQCRLTTTSTDTLLDVGGHRLHLRIDRGERPVTVLFEAGGGATLESWGGILKELAQRSDATVLAYDRAGLGTSDLGPEDLTPLDEVRHIRKAMTLAGVPETTVIVGHSYGGLMALAHAETFPLQVGGLVLVDPMNPRFVAEMGNFLQSTVPRIDEPRSMRERVVIRMSRTLNLFAGHLLASEPRLETPMMVISAGRPWWGDGAADVAWSRSHREMVAVRANRRLVVAEQSTHDIPASEPEVVLSAILEMVARVEK